MNQSGRRSIQLYRNKILQSPDQGHIELLLQNVIATAEALRETEGQSWQVRRGQLIKKRLSNITFEFDEYDLFAGRPTLIKSHEDSAEWEEKSEYIDTQEIWNYGITGHCEPHYYEVMEIGIVGIEKRIRTLSGGADPGKVE